MLERKIKAILRILILLNLIFVSIVATKLKRILCFTALYVKKFLVFNALLLTMTNTKSLSQKTIFYVKNVFS